MTEAGREGDDGLPPRLHIDAATARATITLRRPLRHNRLHRSDLHGLQQQLAQVAADRAVRVLVLTGEGRSFSAGFHLGEISASPAPPTTASTDASPAASPQPTQTDPLLFDQTADALQALPQPSIARLNGGVFGGATDLALACDFRIGVRGMTQRMPAAQIGLHYPAGGLRRAVALLGLAAARRMFLCAPTLHDHDLLDMGFLDVLVAPEALDAEVDALAATLAGGAPLAVQGMKLSLNEIAAGAVDAAALRSRFEACATSADLREGLAALLQRRAPKFEGR